MQEEQDFSFKSLFVPFTNFKAIQWIIVIGIIVYFNSLFNGFVWDDLVYIVTNSQIHMLNFSQIFGYSLFNSSGYYRPLSALYFSLMYMSFSNNPFFYHLIQLSLHITNTTLLFFLFRKFFSKKLSFLLSLVFLIHPIQVESVSFISATDSELFFLFGISSLLLSAKEKLTWKNKIIISFLLLLSILIKETGILFFFSVFILNILLRKMRIIALALFEMISLAVYVFIRFVIGHVYISHISVVPIGSLSLWGRAINMPAVIEHYMLMLIFPINLSIDQQWIIKTPTVINFYLPAFLIIVATIVLIATGKFIYSLGKKQFSYLIFFSLWFLMGLLLLLQIFPLDMTVADRWFYFPLVGFLGVVGVLAQNLKFPHAVKKTTILYGALILITLFSLRTIVRNTNWYDSFTLYAHDSKVETNFDLENNLASEFAKRGDLEQALIHAQKSVKLFPYENNLLNLAIIYQERGDTRDATRNYKLALTKPNYSYLTQKHLLITYVNYAWLLLHEGSLDKAKEIIIRGLNEYPGQAQLWEELAIDEYQMHHQSKALEAIQKAIRILPNNEFYSLQSHIQKQMPFTLSSFPSNF